MYPILACSIIAVGIVAERILVLREALMGRHQFLSSLSDIFTSGFNPAAALNLVDKSPGLLPRLARVAILNRDRSKEDIKDAVEAEAAKVLPQLRKNLNLLGVIAQISPLLGLLGTVIGMINSFASIQMASSAGQGLVGVDIVAGGIWTALITTAAGLTVAIPVYVAHSFLERWADTITNDLEIASADVVRILEGGEL